MSDGTSVSTITVRILDDLGSPEAGRLIDLVSSRGAVDTLTATLGPTDAAGVATGTISSATPGTAIITGTDQADGVVLSQQPVVSFTQGRVLDLTITANKTEVVTGDVVTYRVDIANTTTNDITPMQLINQVPPGFTYLKGSGRMVGAMIVGEFAWSMESLLNRVIDNTSETDDKVFDVIQGALDALPELIEQIKGGPVPTA